MAEIQKEGKAHPNWIPVRHGDPTVPEGDMTSYFKLVYIQNRYRKVVYNSEIRILHTVISSITNTPDGSSVLWRIYNDKGILIEGNTKRYL